MLHKIRKTAQLVLVVLVLNFCLLVINGQQRKENLSSVEGFITDLSGKPISNADIEFKAENGRVFTALSDKEGNYRVTLGFSGKYQVRVHYSGFRIEEAELNLSESEIKYLNFGLEVGTLSDLPFYTVKGRITGKEKEPVKKAVVEITNIYNQKISEKTLTDVNGVYELKLATAGQYVISVYKPSFNAEAKVIELRPPIIKAGIYKLNFILTKQNKLNRFKQSK